MLRLIRSVWIDKEVLAGAQLTRRMLPSRRLMMNRRKRTILDHRCEEGFLPPGDRQWRSWVEAPVLDEDVRLQRKWIWRRKSVITLCTVSYKCAFLWRALLLFYSQNRYDVHHYIWLHTVSRKKIEKKTECTSIHRYRWAYVKLACTKWQQVITP